MLYELFITYCTNGTLIMNPYTSNTMDQQSAVVLADNQGKYFDQSLEDHKILTLFNSGDKIKDLHKNLDIIQSFRTVIIHIGNNNNPKDDVSTILIKMQHLYGEICSLKPNNSGKYGFIFQYILMKLSGISFRSPPGHPFRPYPTR